MKYSCIADVVLNGTWYESITKIEHKKDDKYIKIVYYSEKVHDNGEAVEPIYRLSISYNVSETESRLEEYDQTERLDTATIEHIRTFLSEPTVPVARLLELLGISEDFAAAFGKCQVMIHYL